MTSEYEFQAAIDDQADDAHCRLVFADFLEERGDRRAEGYRALGVLRKYVVVYEPEDGDFCWFNSDPFLKDAFNCLPSDWFALLSGGLQTKGGKPIKATAEFVGAWLDWPSRRTAEDAAALAFLKLPPERRAELLRGN